MATFQKLLLALVFAGLASAKKSSFFPRGVGAIVNMAESEFDEALKDEDQLVFVYVFDAEHEKSN
jgi:hypothetical protein